MTATRVPEPKVALIVRELREANLIPKAGRGAHAAKMKPLDAARVLLALLASDRPVDAPKAVKDFGCLRRFSAPEPAEPLFKLPEPLFKLDLAGDILEDDIAAVIQALADAPGRPLWVAETQLLAASRTGHSEELAARAAAAVDYLSLVRSTPAALKEAKEEKTKPPIIDISIEVNDLYAYIDLPTGVRYVYLRSSFIDTLTGAITGAMSASSAAEMALIFLNLKDRESCNTLGIRVRRMLTSDNLIPISADFVSG
jgi:hypothetical protein